MNTNTTKWIGFAQGLFYPIVAFIVGQLAIALGAGGALNGTVPPLAALFAAGILSIIENEMQKAGYTAMFGMAKQ